MVQTSIFGTVIPTAVAILMVFGGLFDSTFKQQQLLIQNNRKVVTLGQRMQKHHIPSAENLIIWVEWAPNLALRIPAVSRAKFG
jgi:hypothetical protein